MLSKFLYPFNYDYFKSKDYEDINKKFKWGIKNGFYLGVGYFAIKFLDIAKKSPNNVISYFLLYQAAAVLTTTSYIGIQTSVANLRNKKDDYLNHIAAGLGGPGLILLYKTRIIHKSFFPGLAVGCTMAYLKNSYSQSDYPFLDPSYKQVGDLYGQQYFDLSFNVKKDDPGRLPFK